MTRAVKSILTLPQDQAIPSINQSIRPDTSCGSRKNVSTGLWWQVEDDAKNVI